MWLAASAATGAATHDFMLDTGALELEWLPPWLRTALARGINEPLDTWLIAV